MIVGERITAGVDVGTGAVKAAIVACSAGGERVLGVQTERIHRRDPAAVAEDAFTKALEKSGVDLKSIAYVASTGDGDCVSFRDGHFYGMTSHARGATMLEPGCRSVVDLGALHIRVFAIDERSRVLRHRMTSQCASGTGQFLEDIARYLGVRLEEAGPLSRDAARAETCSSICAVLAETDVINMVSRGISMGEIIRGIHDTIAQRVVKLLRSVEAESPVMLTGGMATDVGLEAAIVRRLAEEKVAIETRSNVRSVHAGALGAAAWAAVRLSRIEAGGTQEAMQRLA